MLEVILSLSLFVVAATVIGSAFQAALRATSQARALDKAANLAQSVLTRVSTGQVVLSDASAASFDTDATKADPDMQGWTYDMACQDVQDATGIKSVTVTVHAPANAQSVSLSQWVIDPSAGAGP